MYNTINEMILSHSEALGAVVVIVTFMSSFSLILNFVKMALGL